MLTFPVQTALMSEGIKGKYQHQVNFAQALGRAKHMVAPIISKNKAPRYRINPGFHGSYSKNNQTNKARP